MSVFSNQETWTKAELMRAGSNMHTLFYLFDDPNFNGEISYQLLLDAGIDDFDTSTKKSMTDELHGRNYDDVVRELIDNKKEMKETIIDGG